MELFNNPVHFNDYIRNKPILENFGVSKSMVWSAVMRESWNDNPEVLASRLYQGVKNEHFEHDNIPIEEFTAKGYDQFFRWDSNMSYDEAERIYKRKISEQVNHYIMSLGKGGAVEEVGKFISMVLPSFASPTNLALSFIPIGGQARWAMLAAKYGQKMKMAQHAVSGAVAQAGMEPFLKIAKFYEQSEHSLADSMMNIGAAAAFGGGVGAIGIGAGAIKSRFSSKAPLENLHHDTLVKEAEINQRGFDDIDLPPTTKERDFETKWGQEQTRKHLNELRKSHNLKPFEDDIPIETLHPERQRLINESLLNTEKTKMAQYKSPTVYLDELLKQTDLRQHAVANEFYNHLYMDLKAADVLSEFSAKRYEKEIARALNGESVQSEKAKTIAQIIHKHQSIAIERANRRGANIAQMDNYITRQSHSSTKIRKAGFQAWYNDIFPKLDKDKMVAGSGESLDMKAIWENLSTETHESQFDNVLGSSFASFSSPTSRFEAARKLHFKSADDWLAYHEKYGVGSLADSVMGQLDNLGRAIGLMENMGTNPKAFLQHLKSTAIDALKPKAAIDKHALEQLEKIKRHSKPDDILDILMNNHVPEKPTLAKAAQNIRSLKTMASLGKVLISAIPDLGTMTTELHHQGMPVLKTYRTILQGLGHSLAPQEKKALAKGLGIAVDHLLGGAYTRLSSESPISGVMSKMTDVFFKLNGMHWWDKSFKESLSLVLSHHLAEHVHLPFENLPKLLQQSLVNYDINAANWHYYQGMVEIIGENKFLLPDKAKNIPQALLPEGEISGINLRENLGNNLRRYLLDRIDTAIPTPHAAEKNLAFFGTQKGTWLGEFIRFFMQFKTFPITFVTRPLKAMTVDQIPLVERHGNWKDVIHSFQHPQTWGLLTHLAVTTTALGYISLCANDWLQGKEELPDPTELKTFQAALIKGGGAGIFTDFLLNDYSRYGRPFTQEFAGPVFSDINEIMKIISKARKGELDHPQEEMVKLMLRNTPGRNLIQTEYFRHHVLDE
jgi:molecular chaperone GrpE (heat shock protein)